MTIRKDDTNPRSLSAAMFGRKTFRSSAVMAAIFLLIFVIMLLLTAFTRRGPSDHSRKDNDKFGINEAGFWSGTDAVNSHAFDLGLAQCLLKFFQDENAETLQDFGAGMGKYAEFFNKKGLYTSCYDGNPETQVISQGSCARIDLTKPIRFAKSDWVMSLEVGEHLPKEYESTFISNINRCNRHGALVSWAIPGQGGVGHVNERDNAHIAHYFINAGYTRDQGMEDKLRACSTLWWFKNTIMVFRRKKSAFT